MLYILWGRKFFVMYENIYRYVKRMLTYSILICVGDRGTLAEETAPWAPSATVCPATLYAGVGDHRHPRQARVDGKLIQCTPLNIIVILSETITI